MNFKKVGFMFVVLILALVPVATSAQTSLYIPASGKLGGGFEIRENVGSWLAMGNFGVGLDNGNSKISFMAGGPTEDLGVPVYVVGIEGIQLWPLESGLEIFGLSEISALIVEDLESIPVSYLAGIGLSKHLGTGKVGLKPFAALVYQHLIIDLGDETLSTAGFGTEVGLEYKIQGFSIIARALAPFPFDSSQARFKLGINLFF